ncbi:uncharacterized protein LOC130614558 isoform X2 [Hydractinia symbiolongicarpus]|uniref:uncharacterized protein LOC130614558 isoform X2 n=1 Tax=Hydractinia symbiolongicarpus TaxID=13093 RepID=UPI00254B317C|nr:uncharacterized protein LOC130614558 isoform X2 [Hydractinia symbiolongicarpus]
MENLENERRKSRSRSSKRSSILKREPLQILQGEDQDETGEQRPKRRKSTKRVSFSEMKSIKLVPPRHLNEVPENTSKDDIQHDSDFLSGAGMAGDVAVTDFFSRTISDTKDMNLTQHLDFTVVGDESSDTDTTDISTSMKKQLEQAVNSSLHNALAAPSPFSLRKQLCHDKTVIFQNDIDGGMDMSFAERSVDDEVDKTSSCNSTPENVTVSAVLKKTSAASFLSSLRDGEKVDSGNADIGLHETQVNNVESLPFLANKDEVIAEEIKETKSVKSDHFQSFSVSKKSPLSFERIRSSQEGELTENVPNVPNASSIQASKILDVSSDSLELTGFINATIYTDGRVTPTINNLSGHSDTLANIEDQVDTPSFIEKMKDLNTRDSETPKVNPPLPGECGVLSQTFSKALEKFSITSPQLSGLQNEHHENSSGFTTYSEYVQAHGSIQPNQNIKGSMGYDDKMLPNVEATKGFIQNRSAFEVVETNENDYVESSEFLNIEGSNASLNYQKSVQHIKDANSVDATMLPNAGVTKSFIKNRSTFVVGDYENDRVNNSDIMKNEKSNASVNHQKSVQHIKDSEMNIEESNESVKHQESVQHIKDGEADEDTMLFNAGVSKSFHQNRKTCEVLKVNKTLPSLKVVGQYVSDPANSFDTVYAEESIVSDKQKDNPIRPIQYSDVQGFIYNKNASKTVNVNKTLPCINVFRQCANDHAEISKTAHVEESSIPEKEVIRYGEVTKSFIQNRSAFEVVTSNNYNEAQFQESHGNIFACVENVRKVQNGNKTLPPFHFGQNTTISHFPLCVQPEGTLSAIKENTDIEDVVTPEKVENPLLLLQSPSKCKDKTFLVPAAQSNNELSTNDNNEQVSAGPDPFNGDNPSNKTISLSRKAYEVDEVMKSVDMVNEKKNRRRTYTICKGEQQYEETILQGCNNENKWLEEGEFLENTLCFKAPIANSSLLVKNKTDYKLLSDEETDITEKTQLVSCMPNSGGEIPMVIGENETHVEQTQEHPQEHPQTQEGPLLFTKEQKESAVINEDKNFSTLEKDIDGNDPLVDIASSTCPVEVQTQNQSTRGNQSMLEILSNSIKKSFAEQDDSLERIRSPFKKKTLEELQQQIKGPVQKCESKSKSMQSSNCKESSKREELLKTTIFSEETAQEVVDSKLNTPTRPRRSKRLSKTPMRELQTDEAPLSAKISAVKSPKKIRNVDYQDQDDMSGFISRPKIPQDVVSSAKKIAVKSPKKISNVDYQDQDDMSGFISRPKIPQEVPLSAKKLAVKSPKKTNNIDYQDHDDISGFISKPKIPRGSPEVNKKTTTPMNKSGNQGQSRILCQNPTKKSLSPSKLGKSISKKVSSVEGHSPISPPVNSPVNKTKNDTYDIDDTDKEMPPQSSEVKETPKKHVLIIENNIKETLENSRSLPSSNTDPNNSIGMPAPASSATELKGLKYYAENSVPVGWVIDSITNNELRVHFCAYKYHTLLVKVEGETVKDVIAERLLKEKDTCTGEKYYLDMMERVINVARLKEKYTSAVEVPELLNDVSEAVSQWKPIAHDIYKTFYALLGHVQLEENRVTITFVTRRNTFSVFYLHVDFNCEQQKPNVKATLEHDMMFNILDDIKNIVNETHVEDKKPLLTCSKRIYEYTVNVTSGDILIESEPKREEVRGDKRVIDLYT